MMKACEIIHVLPVCLATALYLLQLSTVDLLSYNLGEEGYVHMNLIILNSSEGILHRGVIPVCKIAAIHPPRGPVAVKFQMSVFAGF